MTTLKTLALTIGCLVAAGTANGGIVIGFETSEGYVAGALSDPNRSGNEVQAGWSGGAQTGFSNNDPGDEQVVATEAHTGTNSWHYARGFGSSGQGTPFSPSLDLIGGTGPGTTFTAEMWFKAASAAGDGSTQNIYMGSYNGNDRTGFNIYLTNSATGSGLSLHTFSDVAFTEVEFAANLNRSSWHKLSISASFHSTDVDLDEYSYTVTDEAGNAEGSFSGNSWPNPWRVANGFSILYGDQIKFADGGGDNLTHQGFYYDDISYSSAATSAGAVPEPSTAIVMGLLGIVGLAGNRRRRRQESVA